MILAVALGLVLLGVMLGARGMRRLGVSLRGLGLSLRGPWRPGAALLGLLCTFGALAMLARGDWWVALALASVAAGAVAAARRRRGRSPSAPAQAAAAGMTREEAAALLGVPLRASAPEAEAAFRRLILKLHPDQGGTAGLSAKLQEARRVMRER